FLPRLFLTAPSPAAVFLLSLHDALPICEPGHAELVDWEPVLDRAGVKIAAHRVAAAYLELAVLVRALEGLSAQVRWRSTVDRGALWAGLFDLRENLLGRALGDLRAIAA